MLRGSLSGNICQILFVVLFSIVACVRPSSKLFAADLPNILILYADDMGYGDLAIQNPDSKISTPNLDRLAQEGMRFTDAHSSAGICTLSRYALLTGRYHWRCFHGNADFPAPSVFSAEELTLPEMLRQAGYRTGCIGKWHLGWNWDAVRRKNDERDLSGTGANNTVDDFDWSKQIPGGPLDHGFDYYYGDDVPNRPPYTWIENDRVLAEPTQLLDEAPIAAEGSSETEAGPMVANWRFDAVMPRLTEKAVEWIGKQRGSAQPFFLYFPWTSPHAPIVPIHKYQGKSKAGPYGDYVYQSDWTAGEVLRALDANGFRENTIVIFSSDNGPANYAYERVRRYGHRSMGPLRGAKGDIWEGGHRVPLVVRWPTVVKPGVTNDKLISQIDFMATIASAIGYELPPNAAEDSQNMLPLLRGDPSANDARDSLVHNTRPDHFAIRRGEWVLIDASYGNITEVPEWFERANGYTKESKSAALYNLREDLGQRLNLIDKYPEKVESLRKLLGQIQSGKHH